MRPGRIRPATERYPYYLEAEVVFRNVASAPNVLTSTPLGIGDLPMSIFGKIMNAIFGSNEAKAAPADTAADASGASPTGGSASTPSAPAGAPSGGQKVDVAKVLDAAVKEKGQKLNWKTSIVDLMKALNIDSSLEARKSLAKELKYTGDMDDSAKMNIWLHKQVIQKLEENGGKVPADLKD
jgi:Domain of unknown function (DUF3597)